MKARETLILASASPRRRELLKQCGYRFRVLAPEVLEFRLRGESPREMVRRLAYEKCESVLARKLPSHSVVLASDTTVIAPSGAVLEKPKNRRDADRMLKLLSGQTHEVLTAYCIGSKGAFRIRRVVKTRVTFRKIDALELQAYLKTSEPYDKAGAYAAQGFAMAWIHKIQGSYTNVVGLPMTEVAKDLLENFSIAPLWRQV